jgi:hypothetical protein
MDPCSGILGNGPIVSSLVCAGEHFKEANCVHSQENGGVCSSETLAITYQISRCHKQDNEKNNLNRHYCESLKPEPKYSIHSRQV